MLCIQSHSFWKSASHSKLRSVIHVSLSVAMLWGGMRSLCVNTYVGVTAAVGVKTLHYVIFC